MKKVAPTVVCACTVDHHHGRRRKRDEGREEGKRS